MQHIHILPDTLASTEPQSNTAALVPSPEHLLHSVETVLKREIPGLESLTAQLDVLS